MYLVLYVILFCISMYFVFFFLLPPLHMAILKEGAATVAEFNPAVIAHLSKIVKKIPVFTIRNGKTEEEEKK